MRKSFVRILSMVICFVLLAGVFPVHGMAMTDTGDPAASGQAAGSWDTVSGLDDSPDDYLPGNAGMESGANTPDSPPGTEASAPDSNKPAPSPEETGLPADGKDSAAAPSQASGTTPSLGHSGGKSEEELLLEWLQSLPVTRYRTGRMTRSAPGDTGAVSVSQIPVNSYNVKVAGIQSWGSIMAQMSINGEPAFCLQLWRLAGEGAYTATNTYSDLNQTQIDKISKYLANYAKSSRTSACYAAAQVLVWEAAYGLPTGGSSNLYARMISGTAADSYMDKSGMPVYLPNNIPDASSRIAAYKEILNGNESGAGILFWSDGAQGQWIATEAEKGDPIPPTPPEKPEKPEKPEPEKKVGYLEITKYDGETNLPLGGAVFRVECEGFIDNAFSVPYGGAVIVIPIPEGKDSVDVTVTEVSPPHLYAPDPAPKTVTVTAGEQVNVARVSFVNFPLSCSLTIYKYERGNRGIPLEGAKFRIRYADPNVSAQVWVRTTDSGGTIKLDLPAAGTLIIEELEAPSGYVIGHISTWDAVVAKGEHKQIDISNDKKADLIVYKKDAQTGQFLSGAVIKATLLRSHTPPYEQNMSYTVTTDASGVALFTNMIPGEYRVEEQSPPQYYLPTDVVHTVSVYDGSTETVAVTFENEPWTGLTIKKVDATNGAGLQGAVFKLYEGTATETTKFLGDFMSNENGLVVIKNLESNKYYTIVEAQAPYGYFVDREHHVQTILIKPDAIEKNLTVIFRNLPKPKLLITKIDEATGNRLPGAVFRVAQRGSAEYVEVTTGSDGTVLLENMDANWYQMTEIRSPSGYLLDSTVHDIELIAGETAKLVVNNSKQPSLTIKKVDEQTGEGIEGVVLRVTREGAVEYQDVTTGKNGAATITGMSPGWVTIVEQRAKDGYILDQTPHYIELKAGEDAEIVIKNRHKPSLKIIKLDSVTKQPLQYVTFSVAYKNGSPIGEFTTDENGEIYLENITPGTVVLTETKGRDGYIILDKEKEVLVEWGKLTTVEFLNQPKNPLLIKKIDSVTGEPLSGAVFAVTKVSGEFVGEYTTGRNGFIAVTGQLPGFFTVTEIKSPDGYILNNAPKTVELKLNQPAEVTFENKPLNGIQIHKIDADTREPLEGVRFVVREKGGSVIGEFVTNSNGLIEAPDLAPGWYQVFESAGLPGYLLDATVKDVELKWNNHVLLEFTNTKLSGLQVRKLDAVTKEPIPGVRFKLTRLSGEYVGDYTTNTGGFFAVDGLEPGYYTCYETATIPGYVLDTPPQTFEIKKGKSVVLEFFNKPLSGLQIRKSDSVTGLPLAGVEFRLTGLDGRNIGNYTTDSAGIVFVPNLLEGWYVLAEIRGLEGYMPDTAPRNIQVKTGELNVVEYRNHPYPNLIVQKVDADTLKPLEGVRFRFLDKYSREIGIYKTNAQGKIHLTGMDAGKYFLQEVEAKEGYVLDATVREVTLQYGKTASIEIKNTPMSTLRVKKIDALTKKPIAGVRFMLYDWKDNIVGEYITDNNGMIELPREIAAGKYKLKEIKAAGGYVLDDTPRTVELKSGQAAEIVIENEPIRGRIQITKKAADYNDITKDKKGALLKGAVFEVVNSRKEVVDRIETDRRGVATTKLLPLGVYSIREITAPKHYLLDDQVFYAKIKIHDDLVQFEVLNKPADISVTVQKYGNYEALLGQTLRYDFKDIANTSTVELDDFCFHDAIPTDAVRLVSISTGTWNERLTYKVLYATNLRKDYRVLADKLNSRTVNELDCRRETLKLKNGEYITDIKFAFGTVQPDFKEVTPPHIICAVNGNLPNEYRFTNRCDVGGRHDGEWAIAKDAWVTIIYANPSGKGKIPQTGF